MSRAVSPRRRTERPGRATPRARATFPPRLPGDIPAEGAGDTPGEVAETSAVPDEDDNPFDDFSDDPEMVPFSFKHPVGFQVAFDEMMERARMVLGYEASIPDCIEAMLAEVAWAGVGGDGPEPRRISPDHPIPKRPSVLVEPRPEAIEHAKATLARVAEYLDDVEQLESVDEPDSPEEALLILRQVHLLRAPGKVLLAHLIRDLRRVGAVELLGYTSVARMVEDLLRLSERSARNRVAESLMFESNSAIEEAFGTGRISTMQAYLIRQLKSMESIEEFVDRARETTWRQFQREYRMLILMRKCNLGRYALRPLSKGNVAEAIEGALVEALGGDREALEEVLRIRGIPPLPPDGSRDPAENPVLMDRLETMLQLIALKQWDEVPATGEADRQTLAALGAETWTRFRLPKQTFFDFRCVLDAYRRQVPPDGPKWRPARVPDWVAMALFFADVRASWDELDPERVPYGSRSLSGTTTAAWCRVARAAISSRRTISVLGRRAGATMPGTSPPSVTATTSMACMRGMCGSAERRRTGCATIWAAAVTAHRCSATWAIASSVVHSIRRRGLVGRAPAGRRARGARTRRARQERAPAGQKPRAATLGRRLTPASRAIPRARPPPGAGGGSRCSPPRSATR